MHTLLAKYSYAYVDNDVQVGDVVVDRVGFNDVESVVVTS